MYPFDHVTSYPDCRRSLFAGPGAEQEPLPPGWVSRATVLGPLPRPGRFRRSSAATALLY